MQQRRLAIMSIVLAVLALTVIATQAIAALIKINDINQLNLLVDIRQQILTHYVDEPDGQELTESAVRGMVEALNDPYTTYVAAEEMANFNKQVHGEFSGIGAEIDVEENQLRITSPLEDSPAWRSGILAGDTVISIDDEKVVDIFKDIDTRGQKVQAAIERLTGVPGTQVRIHVRHESGEEETITVTRAKIDIPTVKGVRRLGNDGHWDFMLDRENKIGYVRLTQFTGKSVDDFRAAVDQLIQNDVKGIIVDLRFDPGGLLEAAVAISDMFLESGKRIVSIKGRSAPEQVYTATSARTIPSHVEIVVLANEASASASEIVTGALSDNQRAKFVGTRTFGKGSVQTIKMFTDDRNTPIGMLKFTNAYYYLPSGRNIHRKPDAETWGVDPDAGFYVPMTPEQIEAMIKARRESDVLRPQNGGNNDVRITPQWIEENLADIQLAAGLKALQGKLTTGQWPTVGETDINLAVKRNRKANLMRQRNMVQQSLEEINSQIEEINKELGGGETEDGQSADTGSATDAPVQSGAAAN